MKEKLICAVLTRVEGIFDGVQREMLKEILIEELRGLELRPSQPQKQRHSRRTPDIYPLFCLPRKSKETRPRHSPTMSTRFLSFWTRSKSP